jgi:protoporphyrinogen oxidase
MILILGAGLTGLSTAYHLEMRQGGGPAYRIVEREPEPGGLCRSVDADGFVFDFTGHLLHLRDDGIRALVHRLMPDAFEAHSRRAFVFSKGTLTPYPFQANTYGLPLDVVRECVEGFVRTLVEEARSRPVGGDAARGEPPSFHDWVLATFGAGIAHHFMFPYNEKLWRRDLREVTSDWVAWSIPKPPLEDVLRGALGPSEKAFGYNPSFLYPRADGIRALPRAFASQVRPVETGRTAVAVDLARREVRFADGDVLPYTTLVSTLPLPELVAMAAPVPDAIRDAAARLDYVSVCNANVGLAAATLPDAHWIYFPERDVPFYRMGVPSNLSKGIVPPGAVALSFEASYRKGEAPGAEFADAAMAAAERAGLVRAPYRRLTSRVLHLEYGYVVFDEHRRRHLPAILDFLRARGVLSTGRYGAWEYSSMEDAIRHGREAADAAAGSPRS